MSNLRGVLIDFYKYRDGLIILTKPQGGGSKLPMHFLALKMNGFLGTKQLQSFDSFRGLFIIKSKKKQVTKKITTLS